MTGKLLLPFDSTAAASGGCSLLLLLVTWSAVASVLFTFTPTDRCDRQDSNEQNCFTLGIFTQCDPIVEMVLMCRLDYPSVRGTVAV